MNEIKSKQLGMNFSTASNRLRKLLLFELVKKCNMDKCHRCGELIESAKELSIDHEKDWLHSEKPVDVENVKFSHLSCNIGARRCPSVVAGEIKFKGVRKKDGNRTKPFEAYIWDRESQKTKLVGCYKTAIDGAKAYDKAAISMFGKQAVTNASLGLLS